MFLIEFELISDNVIYFLLKHSSFFCVYFVILISYITWWCLKITTLANTVFTTNAVCFFSVRSEIEIKKKVKLQKTSSMKTRTWIVIDCKESVNNIMIRMKCAFVLKGYKTHNMDAICKTNIKKCITYSVITQNFLSVKFTRYERGMIKISIIFYIFSL